MSVRSRKPSATARLPGGEGASRLQQVLSIGVLYGVQYNYVTFNPVNNGKHAKVVSLEDAHRLDRAYESDPANYDGNVEKQQKAFAEGEARRAKELESRRELEAMFPSEDNPIGSSVGAVSRRF